MKLPRRQFLRLAAGVVALPAVSRAAGPDAYPAKPVRLMNGFAAGGTADIVARLMGQWLSERLGQQFLTENRTGAASNLATEAVIRAPADGYTLLLVTPANAVNATLYEKLNYDFIRDTAPVGGIMAVANVMEVHPSLPVKTVPEFIAYAKANPGKINMASGGAGTTPHIFGELFEVKAGISLTHVPYRGAAPALNDLLGGQVQVIFDPIPSSIEHIRAGRLRALAVTTATRSEALPSVPSLAEFVPGYDASFWCGISAPKNTPSDIVEKLNTEINAILTDPRTKARFADMNATILVRSPTEFGKLIAEETERWGTVIRAAHIKAE